jgi:imidazolonepropionase-like amidohydrolase
VRPGHQPPCQIPALSSASRARSPAPHIQQRQPQRGHPCPSPAARQELENLVGAGLHPEEALHAATGAPARRFSLTDRGRIAPGLSADLVLVEGDPTADITATRAIVGIWRRGTAVAR